MFKSHKSTKGITLVALVVTIIILLILAGITISQLTGSGLFEKAQQAAEKSKYANAEEKVKLAVMTSYDTTGLVNKEQLKNNLNNIDGIQDQIEKVEFTLTVTVDGYEFEITEIGQVIGKGQSDKVPTTDAGTIVALKDGWGDQTVKYTKTSNGEEVTELTKVSTVYAVSVGNGETVPVPNGFYYVGGTLASGVVISDNEADKNKYAGQADVPSGIEAVKGEDGTTITGITRTLQGNQFVWIPCTLETYKKYNWGTTYRNNIYSTDVTAAELSQVQKYGGFYVGRYESGLDEDITVSTGTMVNASSTEYNVSGTPRIQAGIEPWNFVSYTKSKENAESLYSNSASVNSGLLTGTMWDTMMYFMGDNSYTSTLLTSSTWGNYANTTPTITLGKTAKGYYSSSTSRMDTFTTASWASGTKKTAGTVNTGTNGVGYVWTTGSSEECKLKNLYDVAGNIWEWTEETAIRSTANTTALDTHRVFRGAGVLNSYSVNPACYRGSRTVSNTNITIGFRVALYIK